MMAFLKDISDVTKLRVGRLFELLFAWTPAHLAESLQRIGIGTGDSVMVHCSFAAMKGFTGNASDVIAVLQGLVSDSGAILMPNQPFDGLAIAHAKLGRIFDVRRTPSQMGLLSEIFRRTPGVLRSVHPTHPVAVWGHGAADLIADHHKVATPCGAGSPYARLAARNGKILFLGTTFGVVTYFHTIEEELEPMMAKSPFTSEVFTLLSKNERGEIVTTVTRLFDPEMSKRRNLLRLEKGLEKQGTLARTRIALTPITIVNANDIANYCHRQAREGYFFYDD